MDLREPVVEMAGGCNWFTIVSNGGLWCSVMFKLQDLLSEQYTSYRVIMRDITIMQSIIF
jgi:hypothetical protein